MGRFIRTAAVMIIVFAMLITAAYYLLIGAGIGAIVNEVDNAEALKKELIGEKTIINNDTLMITEFTYNPTGSKVTVIGKKEPFKVDAAFAKKNLIKKE